MRVLKKVVIYCLWTLVAILLAYTYMRIILGASPEYATDYTIFYYLIYEFAFFYIGVFIGGCIALLFVLFDVFYLNKRLKTEAKAIFIRLLIIIGIAVIVCSIHYILEKVIDVI
ncbi:hypothetical protein [Aequorivita sp. Q41]|uniref:hypothetical protein n=1 Tax=Aequorivita sp. Q41 TaxID=3153300 RepID=UPI0032422EDA